MIDAPMFSIRTFPANQITDTNHPLPYHYCYFPYPAPAGAVVCVYRDSRLIAVFTVPENKPGTLWTLFEMDGVFIAK